MKILCVIDNLGSGGAQRQIVELAKTFVDKNHTVYFLTYHEHDFYKEELNAKGINIQCVNTRSYLSRILTMRRYIRGNNFDIVLSFLEASNFICEIAGLPFRKWKLIVGERSANPRIFKSIKLRFYRWCHLLADYVVANSYANIQIVKEINPLLPDRKCKVIYNLVGTEFFTNNHTGPIEKNGGNDKIHLIVGASHQYLKNSRSLVLALSSLPPYKRYRLKVSWYGDKVEPPYFDRSFPETLELVRKNGLEDTIKFYPATRNFHEVMAKADVVGLFSFFEGLPNTICEAIAMGKPVIVSKVSDMPSLLAHNPSQVFDPHKIEDISKALEAVINQSELVRSQIGIKNKRVAETHFLKEKIAVQYLRLMEL